MKIGSRNVTAMDIHDYSMCHSKTRCVSFVLVIVFCVTVWVYQGAITTIASNARTYPVQNMRDQGQTMLVSEEKVSEVMLRDHGQKLHVPKQKISDVLMFGYWRSGSTFTSSLLGRHKNATFINEPLMHFPFSRYSYFKSGYICKFSNAQCNKTADLDKKAVGILSKYYTCKESKISGGMKPCSRISASVMKVLRLGMSLATRLLDRFPNLKLVYLVRDPRPMMLSRNQTNLPGDAQSMCLKVEDDYNDYLRLRDVYPGRIYKVYYEDLATNTMETVKNMYDFVGFTFDYDDERRIQEMIKSPRGVVNKQYNVFRKNSTSTAYAWRRSISDSLLESVNKGCSRIYDLLGYPQMKNREDLDNYSIPLRFKST